ncbi:MAG: hypothetical protein R6X25_03105 [Candidatus Krumholzibacteriia bacterium]
MAGAETRGSHRDRLVDRERSHQGNPIVRYLLALALAAGLLGSAAAADLENRIPAKSDGHVLRRPVHALQGGDDIDTAVPIPSLPFTDSGSTCAGFDDYDEVCPYPDSASPDLVYSFTPAADVRVDIDLCGSIYDTKVYVYDAGMSVVACNDDYYYDDPCGPYASFVGDVPLAGGRTYAIVVDGYGGDCGEYSIEVAEHVSCIQVAGVPEGEPDLVDGYVDRHNGGCNSPPDHPFQDLGGDEAEHLTLRGVSGWYDVGTTDYRDTDWFRLLIGDSGRMSVTIDAEHRIRVHRLVPDCANAAVLQYVQGGPCSPSDALVIDGNPGDTVWLAVSPISFDGDWITMFDYVLQIDGLRSGIFAEPVTWSVVKGIYR